MSPARFGLARINKNMETRQDNVQAWTAIACKLPGHLHLAALPECFSRHAKASSCKEEQLADWTKHFRAVRILAAVALGKFGAMRLSDICCKMSNVARHWQLSS